MNCARRLRWAAALALLVFAPLVAAEPLGRLFLSPEQRSVLESQRQFSGRKPGDVEGVLLRLDGIVRTSRGKAMVWVNGQAVVDGSIVVRPVPDDPARVLLSVGLGAPVVMRIGETLERSTRLKVANLAGVRVLVSPADATRTR